MKTDPALLSELPKSTSSNCFHSSPLSIFSNIYSFLFPSWSLLNSWINKYIFPAWMIFHIYPPPISWLLFAKSFFISYSNLAKWQALVDLEKANAVSLNFDIATIICYSLLQLLKKSTFYSLQIYLATILLVTAKF